MPNIFGAGVRRGLQRLRLARACWTQHFYCGYDFTLANRTNVPVQGTVLYPIPPSLPYQRVSALEIFGPKRQILREDRFLNQYVSVPFALGGQTSWRAGLRANITVRPRFSPTRYAGDADCLSPEYTEPAFALTPEIHELAQRVVGSSREQAEIVERCYTYVVAHLTYGNPISGLYAAGDALRLPCVDCGGFSTLLGALLATQGMRSRLLVGFETGWPQGVMHAWLETRLDDGKFLVLDPSVDYLSRRGRTRRVGGLGFVGSDRIVYSMGTDISLRVDRQPMSVPILQHPIVVADRPDAIDVRLQVSAQHV